MADPTIDDYRHQALKYNKWIEELQAEVERLAHGICDSLEFLPSPHQSAGTAILRGLLIGTTHEGHDAALWEFSDAPRKEIDQ